MGCIKSLANCPEGTKVLAYFGGAVIIIAAWIFIGALTASGVLAYWGKKRYQDLDRKQKETYVLSWIFWPIVWIGVVLTWIIGVLELPFTAARKRDLQQMEERISEQIENRNVDVIPVIPVIRKFKSGDLITGIRGNPDDYKHLDEGCVCRVLEIDDKGQMEVVLVNHWDFEGQKSYIGNTFKAPARNFVKYPRATKRKSVKRTKKK